VQALRTSEEVSEELEALRVSLCDILAQPFALEFVDLQYIAQQVGDLKQELRISKANEL